MRFCLDAKAALRRASLRAWLRRGSTVSPKRDARCWLGGFVSPREGRSGSNGHPGWRGTLSPELLGGSLAAAPPQLGSSSRNFPLGGAGMKRKTGAHNQPPAERSCKVWPR